MSPAITIPNIKLNSGYSIPALGFGTFESKAGEVEQAVKDAIDIGYRHIDCAAFYKNEAEVGNAVREKIQEGVVKREDVFITSKVWSTRHSKEAVKQELKKSLSKFCLDYLDLYLIHWPMGFKEDGNDEWFPKDAEGKIQYSDVDITETWAALEECVRDGLVKSIGVSNFNASQIEKVLSMCTIPPASNQVECHAYFPQTKLLNFCKSKGISVTAYSPLGSPARSWLKEGEPVLMEEPVVKAMASKYNKSPAQVLLRFQVQRGVIPIPKSVTKSRIEANAQIFDFELSEDDLKTLSTMPHQMRYCPLDFTADHPLYPFHAEF